MYIQAHIYIYTYIYVYIYFILFVLIYFMIYFLFCLPSFGWSSLSKVNTAGVVLARTCGEDTAGGGWAVHGDDERGGDCGGRECCDDECGGRECCGEEFGEESSVDCTEVQLKGRCGRVAPRMWLTGDEASAEASDASVWKP